ncbi:hypothetical protein SAMN05445504_4672 [Burkholderia sp. CF099]|jgi:biotin carboxylase|nr:hypothetical protein SAMN05445504_4672 [Burkholderia sp. CF099]
MNRHRGTLLIVDYNLSRVTDVIHMSDYARRRYNVDTVLIRDNPEDLDTRLCDHVIGLDPLSQDFVDSAVEALSPWLDRLRGGIVFSDNAVQNGAALLERLGLRVDSSRLALGAFSKLEYRRAEANCRVLVAAQRVMAPDSASIASLEELEQFAHAHPEGFVVKPSCEGNNRGVVIVRPGDDLFAALSEVAPYLENGVICEQIIPYHREFSFDGIADLSFVTEKMSASGRYPVEIAQVLPARVNQTERETLLRTGRLANWLVGQRDGPFHNEIKVSDDGKFAAVVEPNRRPAGMKIWNLAATVYGVDFYHLWIDSVLGDSYKPSALEAKCQAATVMLGVKTDRRFAPADVLSGSKPLVIALTETAFRHGLSEDELLPSEFAWLSQDRRLVPAIPRDNSDFVAYACLSLHTSRVDIRDVVRSLRECWADALERTAPLSSTGTSSAIDNVQTYA